MRKIVLICLAWVWLTLSACFDTQQQAQDTSTEDIAREWIQNNADTYVYRWWTNLEHTSTEQLKENKYKLVFEFEANHAWYGQPAEDEMAAQVITPHTIKLKIHNEEVTSAITNEEYDELNQEKIESEQQQDMEEEYNSYENSDKWVTFEYPANGEVTIENQKAKLSYLGEGNQPHSEITDGFVLYAWAKAISEDLESIAQQEYEEQSQIMESIQEVQQIDFRDDIAYEFAIRWWYWNKHTYKIFEDDGMGIVVSYSIMWDDKDDYQNKIDDVLDSLKYYSDQEWAYRQIEYEWEDINTTGIKVLDEDWEEVGYYWIDQFNEWTQTDAWEEFDPAPEVGMRKIEPGSFWFFDRSATLDPDGERFAFSVHDYAAASTTTIVWIYEYAEDNLEVLKTPIRWSISDFVWSEDWEYIAFTQWTARAWGDYFSVVEVENMQKMFELSWEDIISKLDPENEQVEEQQFMPQFRNITWEDAETIYFETNDVDDDVAEWPSDDWVSWTVSVDGDNLEKQ